jgi:hypothetical protein
MSKFLQCKTDLVYQQQQQQQLNITEKSINNNNIEMKSMVTSIASAIALTLYYETQQQYKELYKI